MAESNDLPFRAEYAKSGRAGCKTCKNKIEKDELRMAVMVQSPMFDGKMPMWHHFRCFFPKFKVKTEADIAHFNSLRWEDQERIRTKIGDSSSAPNTPSTSKGRKRKPGSVDKSTPVSEFSIEYAKSAKAGCKGCEEKILKNEIRISKMDRESESARRFGPHPAWYHVDCFSEKRSELEFFEDGSTIPGFAALSAEDQGRVKEKIKKTEPSPAKKIKAEPVDEKEKKTLKEQSVLVYKFRDELSRNLKKKEMASLLEFNEQDVPPGESKMLDRLSDIMAFGALEPCSECQGQFVFSNDGYHCTGNLTEWTKCMNATQTPNRRPFEVPDEMKEFDFLNNYKYKKRERVFPSNSVPSTPKPSASTTSRASRPLDNAKIVLVGKLEAPKESLQRTIARLGGTVVSQIDKTTTCVISTQEEVKKMNKKMKEARESDVHVVSEEFLSAVENGGLSLMIHQHNIASWGGDPEDRLNASTMEKKLKSGKSQAGSFTSGKSTKVKLTVKGGASVEEDSGLAEIAHIIEDKSGPLNAVLGMVDIGRGTNSYYKLQLLKSDKGNRFWVYRAWGRVGTTIGGNKKEEFDTKQEALIEFKRLYLEKTGCSWENRSEIKKTPGCFYPIDVDYGGSDNAQKMQVGSGSKLHNSLQELMCLIFDVEKMKKAMLEFEIDLEKMPLGKLSKKQITQAYSVLTELQNLLAQEDVKNKKPKLMDASNRFFTLIPHDFGTAVPPILDSEEVIKTKVEMLDFLLDVEIGFNLASVKDESGAEKHPIDSHYEQLKTKIDIIDKKSEEFQRLVTYVKNTHAATHQSYELDVEEIFKVSRQGELKRYKPFRKLHNRKLLWHGSRTTNYAGILSQGLRIAPPEAPVTGYMFGKGIYFADMVSKSANYCFTNKENNTGLLLLCEVALGNMHELTHADHITKLPENKHSTKGLGQTHPDPAESIHVDGVEIPLGKAVKSKVQSSLLYNEYIVYDIAQVNIQYILRMNFKFKY